MSSNAVVALENYPGVSQQSWRADEMGTHMTLLLWCNMALFTVHRENKQLRVICGEKSSPGRGTNCTKKRKWKILHRKSGSLWKYSVMLVHSGWGLPRRMALLFLTVSWLFLAH